MRRCACGVLVEDGRILLGKRSPRRKLNPNAWDMIGGHQEKGEALDDTLRRELEEEIGVTPTEFREIAVLAERSPEVHGERAYHVFAVTAWRGPGPAMRDNEHSEIGWFTVDEALALDLAHPGYKDVLKWI